jgi:hypothetical protein
MRMMLMYFYISKIPQIEILKNKLMEYFSFWYWGGGGGVIHAIQHLVSQGTFWNESEKLLSRSSGPLF